METISNLNTDKLDQVFSMTGFNYNMTTESNEDGTENITFNCPIDAKKFRTLYNEL